MINPTTTALPLYHPYSAFRYSSHDQPLSEEESPIFDDDDQIPTVTEFKTIIDDYLNNLSPKKRDKALVDTHRYCLIQQVLRDPRNTAISTAQFRFWVKKMFQLQPGTTDVVCHDNKPVAMKEQIYEILVKAHREAHHGGRDKTSALVRRRYSWIPKELVARFVRHCPFCITRRNSGHSPSVLIAKCNSPRYRYSFDATDDLSSGPPSSSDSSYDTMPPPHPSPGRTYFNSIYQEEEQQQQQQQQQQQHQQHQQHQQQDFLVAVDPYDCLQQQQQSRNNNYYRPTLHNIFYNQQQGYHHSTFYYPSIMRTNIDLMDPHSAVLSTQQQPIFSHFTTTAATPNEDVVTFHDI